MNNVFYYKNLKTLFLTLSLCLIFLSQASAQNVSAQKYIEAHKERAIK